MILFEKLTRDGNGKEFMKSRELITSIFYVISMISYIVFWLIKHPTDTPQLSLHITCILSPLFTIGLYCRSYYYLFIYNWFYTMYLSVTLVTFFLIADVITIPNYQNSYVGYEIINFVAILFLGVSVSIGVSLPFKIVHFFILGSTKFYYDSSILDSFDRHLYPEKYKEENKKIKNKFEYDSFNETQLQAELQVALKEERFEAAEKIRKILENKFR